MKVADRSTIKATELFTNRSSDLVGRNVGVGNGKPLGQLVQDLLLSSHSHHPTRLRRGSPHVMVSKASIEHWGAMSLTQPVLVEVM
jgi:hypothetical protein